MKKVLIIESCPGTPHTDTSLEIAINEKNAGSSVFISPIFHWNGYWEFSDQYPKSSHKALAGFILANIQEICKKWNIPVVYPNIKKVHLSEEDFTKFIINKKRFLDRWELFTIVTSVISNFTFDAEPDLTAGKNLENSRILTEVGINTYFATKNLVEIIQPDLIYYFNGRWASCAPIEWAAKDLNIKTLQHERGGTTNKYALYTGHHYRMEDQKNRIKKAVSVVDKDILRSIGARWYWDMRNGTSKSWPSPRVFDDNRIPTFLQNKKYIAYFPSSEDEFAWIPGNNVNGYLGSQQESFLLLKNICKGLGKLLVVRVHPIMKSKPKENLFWNAQADENTMILESDKKYDTYSIIENAECIVSFTSTVGIESAFMGKPSVILGGAAWLDEPGFLCPKNSKELAYFLSHKQQQFIPDYVYEYGYYNLNFGEEFNYYHPQSFWSGKFLGHRIQPSPIGL